MASADPKQKTKIAWQMLKKSDGYSASGVHYDPISAYKILEQRKAAGDAEAMWILGLCKEFGWGTKMDIKQAEALYALSSKKGNAVGTFLTSKEGKIRGSLVIRRECLLKKHLHSFPSPLVFDNCCLLFFQGLDMIILILLLLLKEVQ